MVGDYDEPGRQYSNGRGVWGSQGSNRSPFGSQAMHSQGMHGSHGKHDFDKYSGELNQMRKVKQTVFDLLEPLEQKLQQRGQALERQRADLHAQRERVQSRREELITLRAELEQQMAAATAARYGIWACCIRPTNERAIEIESRKERRREIANYAKEAFEGADENDDRELTLEELRQIEGENAEIVMMEADVNGDGVLSKREYVNYKIHVAKQVGRQARRAFNSADLNNDKELTIEELRVIEGDNAETVMREADVDRGGSLSKREYVDYKIRKAAHGALRLR